MLPEYFGDDPLLSNAFIEAEKLKKNQLELAEIYVEAFAGAPWYESWTREEALKEILRYQESSDFVIRNDDRGNVLGFGIGQPVFSYPGVGDLVLNGWIEEVDLAATYYIAELCTKSEARGRGVCTEVVEELLATSKQKGFLQVITRTRVDNYGMIRIFERLGFAKLGVYSVETGGEVSERVVMLFGKDRE